MTTQFPDTCMIVGRPWEIVEWEGSLDSIPTSESLGFKTKVQSTANWSGRIDHFRVHRNRLYLVRIDVHLDDSSHGITPPRARLEEVIRPGRVFVSKQTFFVYDDLIIPFSGAMLISGPSYDEWDIPGGVQDEEYDPVEERTLLFVEGFLASVTEGWWRIDLESTLERAAETLRCELLDLMPDDGIVLPLWDRNIRFEEESFTDLRETAFGSKEYAAQQATILAEDLLRWIHKYDMDLDQKRFEEGEFEVFIREQCQDFVRTWRKNVAEAFHRKLPAL